MNIDSSVVLQNILRHNFKYNLYKNILRVDKSLDLYSWEINQFTSNLVIFNNVFVDLNNIDKL